MTRTLSQPATEPKILKAALALLELGYWALLIHPNPPDWKPGEKTEKRPIGEAWGVERWSVEKIERTAADFPGAGVGIALGPGRGPGGSWPIDLEGDGDQAADSLAKLLGGEVPDTPGWGSARGSHTLFVADGERLLSLLTACKARPKKGAGHAGVYELDELPGLEFRIGGYKPDGMAKQTQSVVPPTVGNDGNPRAWTVSPRTPIAPLPEAAYAFLERLAAEKAREAKAEPRKRKGKAVGRPGDSYAMAALRDECDAVEAEPEKNRNNRLNTAAFNLGQLVGAKALVRSEVETALAAAARKAGLGEREIALTIQSGLAAGEAQPRDLSGIGTGRSSYPPPATPNGEHQHQAEPDPLNLTEWGNARRLVVAHGTRLRYCKPLSQWFEWDGCRWCPDQSGAIWRWAKDTVRRLGHEAANTEDDRRRKATLRWALKSEEKRVIAAMIELAWSEPGIPIMPDTLDADPWLLNTPSGTVDLKTGRLRPHRQDDLISKITSVPFDLGAECPRWEQTVLPEIFSGDREMVAYLRRALGYSLTGIIGEHALFLCHGTGRNGKNTVLDTVHTILGEYATVINPRVLLTAGKNDHPAAIADLMGRRFVPTDEVDEGEELAESLVKRLTGNKTLKGRFMRQNPFEFPALFKLWMLANCKPEIHGQDEGVWSRIRVIPFEVFFPPEKRIKGLSDILVAAEGPGILRWMVDGCLEWQRIGLAEPAKVREAIQTYRNEQDVIGDFIDQCCESFLDHPSLRDQARVQAGVLYNRYAEWCKENGEKTVLTNRRFASKITGRGYKLSPSNGVHYRHGITLKTVKSEDSDEQSADDRPY
jgi:P4 family phage/plasmid primase-like protien